MSETLPRPEALVSSTMPPVVIVTGDFVRTGGMDRANFALATFSAASGREVHLVGHRVDDTLRQFPNVTFHRVTKPLNSHLLGAPFLAKAGKRVGRLLASRCPIVIVNGGNCRWTGNVNWVHYVHAAWQPQVTGGVFRRFRSTLARRQSLRQERSTLNMAKIIIVNSNRTARDLIEHLNIPKERIRMIYYGIDANMFHPATDDERAALQAALGWRPERRVAVFIGAMSDRRKGFDTLFEAWKIFCRNDHETDLVVVGRGSEIPFWQAQSIAAGLSDRIRFLGFRDDVPNLLRAADLLVAPTRYEAYGLGVHEALCCGLPAIVSKEAGVAERLPPELTGLLLIDPTDSNQLAAKLFEWKSKKGMYRLAANQLGTDLRCRTWDDMAGDILQQVESR